MNRVLDGFPKERKKTQAARRGSLHAFRVTHETQDYLIDPDPEPHDSDSLEDDTPVEYGPERGGKVC